VYRISEVGYISNPTPLGLRTSHCPPLELHPHPYRATTHNGTKSEIEGDLLSFATSINPDSVPHIKAIIKELKKWYDVSDELKAKAERKTALHYTASSLKSLMQTMKPNSEEGQSDAGSKIDPDSVSGPLMDPNQSRVSTTGASAGRLQFNTSAQQLKSCSG
jgi:hypothetical protein